MASLETDFCTLCNDDEGTSIDAVTWCPECEVFLCTDCEKHHKKSRMSKEHNTMSTKNYKKLPKFMKEVSSQCKDHKKKFEVYCSVHACPCCVRCIIEKHQKCQDMKSMEDILKHVKSSASIQVIEKDLKDVEENLDNAIKYINAMISTNIIQKTLVVKKIRKMRKSIDEYLNILEQNLIDDLESKHSKLKSDMCILVQQMKRKGNQIGQLHSEFSIMTKYATELQMYVGLIRVEKTTSQAAKYLESLENGDCFYEKNLEVKISSALQSIVQEVKSFGDIYINTKCSTLRAMTGRKDQAQYFVPNTTFKQIYPSLLCELTFPGSLNIKACLVLPDRNFLILDCYNRIVLFNKDGSLKRVVVTFTKYAKDACVVKDNTVAVTFESEHRTALVDVKLNTIIRLIKLSHSCYGVSSDGQILVISSEEKITTIVNLNDMSQTILNGMGARFISLFEGKIYGTSKNDSKVYCFKCNGDPLWKFQYNDIDEPAGLTLDKNGFIYVASGKNNRIVVISPDGKTSKSILSEANRINDPFAIDINREAGLMIVSFETTGVNDVEAFDSAMVFEIK